MGPYATQVLADLGADVVKVEPPTGDDMRYAAPARTAGMGHIFLHLNRNKRSVVLDLKQPAARDALLRLVETADVLVHNLRPRAVERLGVTYDDVPAVNPRIVYAEIRGFRSDGPYGDRPAYDDVIQGLVALPSLLAASGTGEPRFVPATVCDRITGLRAFGSIAAALFARERTGRGQHLELAMFETLAEFVLSDQMGGRTREPPAGPMGYPLVLTPERRPYPTPIGHLFELFYTDRQWRSFARIVGRPTLLDDDPLFATRESRSQRVDEAYAFVAGEIAKRTTDEWLESLAAAEIPAVALATLESLLEDPHLRETGFFSLEEHPTEGPIRVMDVPGRGPEAPPALRRHAPRLGEHTVEVLREAGIVETDVAALLD